MDAAQIHALEQENEELFHKLTLAELTLQAINDLIKNDLPKEAAKEARKIADDIYKTLSKYGG